MAPPSLGETLVSLYDYEISKELSRSDPPFYALLMAAMRQADTDNTEKLKAAWPDVYAELSARYHAPGGKIPEDDIPRRMVVTDGDGNIVGGGEL